MPKTDMAVNQSSRGWTAAATVCVALPVLIAFNLRPSGTVFNQTAALIGWAAWLGMIAVALPTGYFLRGNRGAASALAALALILAAALASPGWTGLPTSLMLSSAGVMLGAALALAVGAGARHAGLGLPAFRALCFGLVVAGVASSLVGLVQVFAPGSADGAWIARSAIEGRAAGNMRQPNHLSSLLIWSFIAVAWLGEAQLLKRATAWGLGLLLVFAVVLSASRSGVIGVLLLAAWGGIDRRLSRQTRSLLIAAPLVYLLCWLGMSFWAEQTRHVFGGETRFSAAGDVSSSRFGVWANTLSLIAAHPWLGVGFGEFNFAWSLTPFPGRPTALFDHTHNLPLQLAVELGVPLALLVLALLLSALWCALRAAWASTTGEPAGPASMLRAAFMLVVMIAVHSLLEYPLWYAYFLLPTAFALGMCLGRTGEAGSAGGAVGAAMPRADVVAARARAPGAAAGPRETRPLLMASLLLACGSLAALVDYSRVVVIFSPLESGTSLAQRINDGRRSWFFAHHADYAAGTTEGMAADPAQAYRQAPHNLLDARLMMAWAKALDRAGDPDRARYVAQRLKEFHHPRSEEFFKPCGVPPEPGKALPFQCLEPSRALSFQDFR
jgi:O-antigen ligase